MKISDIFVNCELKKSQLQLSPHINKVSKGARPPGSLNTVSATLFRRITAASALPILSSNPTLSHWSCSNEHMSRRHYCMCAIWSHGSSSASQERRRREETRDGKDVRGGLLRAPSHFPLRSLIASQTTGGWEWLWAGNKLLIDHYLNGGKRTDVTLLIPLHFYQLNSEYSVEHLWYGCSGFSLTWPGMLCEWVNKKILNALFRLHSGNQNISMFMNY